MVALYITPSSHRGCKKNLRRIATARGAGPAKTAEFGGKIRALRGDLMAPDMQVKI
jgi:hypothetical protein